MHRGEHDHVRDHRRRPGRGWCCGVLLARAGIDADQCSEKHADFLRDFSAADTLHPTTRTRLLGANLACGSGSQPCPTARLSKPQFDVSPGRSVAWSRLPAPAAAPHPYVAMVPQWDLLNLLAEAGEAEPTFTLRSARRGHRPLEQVHRRPLPESQRARGLRPS